MTKALGPFTDHLILWADAVGEIEAARQAVAPAKKADLMPAKEARPMSTVRLARHPLLDRVAKDIYNSAVEFYGALESES